MTQEAEHVAAIQRILPSICDCPPFLTGLGNTPTTRKEALTC